MNLSKWPIGASAVVTGYTDEYVGLRLSAMGVLPGHTVAIQRKAFFGGTLFVSHENGVAAIRPDEAACITVQKPKA